MSSKPVFTKKELFYIKVAVQTVDIFTGKDKNSLRILKKIDRYDKNIDKLWNRIV